MSKRKRPAELCSAGFSDIRDKMRVTLRPPMLNMYMDLKFQDKKDYLGLTDFMLD